MWRWFTVVVGLLWLLLGRLQADEGSEAIWTCDGLEPSCIVNGCVNAITGQYIICQADLTTRTLEPIQIVRSHASGVGHRSLTDLWSLGDSAIEPIPSKKNLDIFATSLLVRDPNGSRILFRPCDLSRNCREASYDRPWWWGDLGMGYCNTGSGEIGGATNLKNCSLSYHRNGRLQLRKGSGETLHYSCVRPVEADHHIAKEGQWLFLHAMDRPNGRRLEFVRTGEALKAIRAKGAVDLAEVVVPLGVAIVSHRYESCDGQWVEYHFGGRRDRLTRVRRSGQPDVTYQYDERRLHHFGSSKPTLWVIREERPEGRFLETSYYQAKENAMEGLCVHLEDRKINGDKVDHPAVGRVREQFAPVGRGDKPVAVGRFRYHFTFKRGGSQEFWSGQTDFYDAEGNLTQYAYDEHSRLTAITYYDGDQKLLYQEEFRFDDAGNLLCKVRRGADRCAVAAVTLEYDQRGNVVREVEWGSLTGRATAPLEIGADGLPVENGVERRVRTASFAPDLFPLLGKEQDNRKRSEQVGGRLTRYSYREGSDLITAALTFIGGRIVERRFLTYDENGAPIEEIFDDGSSEQREAYEDVAVRRIVRTQRYPLGRAVGLPQRVEELYWDPHSGVERQLWAKEYLYDERNFPVVERHFDANDELRYAIQTQFDDGGRVVSKQDPEGAMVEYAYDLNGNLIEERGPIPGYVVYHTYDRADRRIVTRRTAPGQAEVTHYRYDLLGRLVEEENSFGQKICRTYDAIGRQVGESAGFVETLEGWRPLSWQKEYGPLGHVVRQRDGNGETTCLYTIHGKPVKVTYPDGSCEVQEYDLEDRLVRAVTKEGVERRLEYDECGGLSRVVISDPLGKIVKESLFQHKGDRLLSSRDPEGFERFYFYDGAGRLIEERSELGHVRYSYDPLGRLHRKEIQYGEERSLAIVEVTEYDLCDRPIEERVESGDGRVMRRTSTVYDALGRPIQRGVNGDRCHVTRTQYDLLGRPVRIVDPLGATTKIQYVWTRDGHGQPVAQTISESSLDTVTYTTRDVRGLVTREERLDPFGETVSKIDFLYDLAGHKIEERHALLSKKGGEQRVRWKYGVGGRLEMVEEELGKRTVFCYNALGQKVAAQLPSGYILEWKYDGLGRPVEELGPGFHYRYVLDRCDRIVVAEDRSGHRIERSYDGEGRLLFERDEAGRQVGIWRDGAGRVTHMQLPGEHTVAYTYDGPNLASVARLRTGGEELYRHTYLEYDMLGRWLFDGNGVRRTWDAGGRPLSIDSPGYSMRASYDRGGRLIAVQERDPKGRLEPHFTYDSLSNLTSDENHGYEYDSLSNRVKRDGRPLHVDRLNRLLVDSRGQYHWNENGAMIWYRHDRDQIRCRYDGRNRLIEVESGDAIYRYRYDAFNRRVAEEIERPEGVERFAYLFYGDAELGRLREDGSWDQFRLLGSGIEGDVGAIVAMELGDEVWRPTLDWRGSVRLLTSLDGERMETYRYTAFGEEDVPEEPASPWRFSSKRVEPYGWVNFGRRHYAPTIALWTTPDPAGFEEGLNLYSYVHNQPLTAIDPDGRMGVALGLALTVGIHCGVNYLKEQCKIRVPRGVAIGLQVGALALTVWQAGTELGMATLFSRSPARVAAGRLAVGGGRFLTYVNGIWNTIETFKESLNYLCTLADGLQFFGIHNPTNGKVRDVIECLFGLCRAFSPASQMLVEQWQELLADRGASVCHICHSQGAIITKSALKRMPVEMRARIYVVAVAPATSIHRHLCADLRELSSKGWDLVPYFDIGRRLRTWDRLERLECHPKAWKIFDHGIDSPTFKGDLREIIQKYQTIGRI